MRPWHVALCAVLAAFSLPPLTSAHQRELALLSAYVVSRRAASLLRPPPGRPPPAKSSLQPAGPLCLQLPASGGSALPGAAPKASSLLTEVRRRTGQLQVGGWQRAVCALAAPRAGGALRLRLAGFRPRRPRISRLSRGAPPLSPPPLALPVGPPAPQHAVCAAAGLRRAAALQGRRFYGGSSLFFIRALAAARPDRRPFVAAHCTALHQVVAASSALGGSGFSAASARFAAAGDFKLEELPSDEKAIAYSS